MYIIKIFFACIILSFFAGFVKGREKIEKISLICINYMEIIQKTLRYSVLFTQIQRLLPF